MKLINKDYLEALKEIPSESIDLILTDPPYGLTRNEWDKELDLEAMWKEFNRVAKERAAIVFMAQEPFTSKLILSNLKNFKYRWTWFKHQCGNFLNARRQPLRNCEDIGVFYRKQCTYIPQMRKGEMQLKNTGKPSDSYNNFEAKPHYSDEYFPTTLLDIPCPRFKNGHPTQKPVELMEYLIRTYTHEKDIVLDPFMGSGTTGVACQYSQRDFIGIELNKEYFEMAKKRILETESCVGI